MAKKNDTTTQAAEKAQTVSPDVRITFVERENSPSGWCARPSWCSARGCSRG